MWGSSHTSTLAPRPMPSGTLSPKLPSGTRVPLQLQVLATCSSDLARSSINKASFGAKGISRQSWWEALKSRGKGYSDLMFFLLRLPSAPPFSQILLQPQPGFSPAHCSLTRHERERPRGLRRRCLRKPYREREAERERAQRELETK